MQKQNKVDRLTAIICQSLPFDWAIYERGGQCTRPTEACDFCKPFGDSPFCYKKTSTLKPMYDK
ncbi:MAG: hypothetical protein NT001_05270 [Candidatus Woesearchaeota archaeon]|nr:hypothetical protein [Candidatus Woesearchaeota archaeon]